MRGGHRGNWVQQDAIAAGVSGASRLLRLTAFRLGAGMRGARGKARRGVEGARR
jgi:hypothetical protein